ncbi:PQQ-binding-like beta-propeller repeat protein [Tahibacter soli]|uniref:PQQ-binding-like beta-propeller repeat protein n=1 Tax=Tahibacter soli TaxID=2983605 RepID=A0A9X3YGQ8_9GAMM|nr:PQQ-binding-like beta-propeller repeat protein [Tahibacter soli]MDC8011192.1 PQQ-binding-like beta-propeller repeat protein [Tahibacter soli]
MSLRCALTASTLAALVLSADAATAPAADWRHVEPAPPRAVAFDRFVPDGRDGIWAFDDGAVRHIDASGRATVADRVLLGVDGARREFGDGLALADGGAIVFSRGDGACRIGRVDAQAHLAWSRDEPDGCARIAADAGGTTWFSGLRRLARIGRDGAMAAQVDLSLFGLADTTALAVDADGGAIVAVRDARQNASTHVASYAPDGRQRWVRDGGSASVTAIAILENGDVVTAGIGAAGQRGPLQIAAMSPDGTPRWTRTVAGDEDDSQAQLFADADGLVVVGHHAVGSTGTSTTVARLTHAGAVRWQASSCNGRFDRATASPAGDVAVGCIDRTPGLHRWNEDGQRAAFIAVPWSYVTDLDFGPRGTLLATGYTDPPPAGGEINALAFDVAGNAVASPLAGVVQSDIGEALAQHVAPDGTTYLASRSGYLSGPRGERLSKIDARGNVLWSRDIGHRLRATYSIVARADRVCATGRFLPSSGFDAYAWTNLCLDAATGDILWQEGVSATQAQSFAGLLDDGRLFAVFAGNGAFQVMRIDRDGRPRLAPPIAGLPVAATIEGSGRTTVAIANSPYQPTALNLVRLDANGAVVFSTNEPASASPCFRSPSPWRRTARPTCSRQPAAAATCARSMRPARCAGARRLPFPRDTRRLSAIFSPHATRSTCTRTPRRRRATRRPIRTGPIRTG